MLLKASKKDQILRVYILVTSCPRVIRKIGSNVRRHLMIYLFQIEQHTDIPHAFSEQYKYTSRLL
jgi:hypothetical protein